LCPTSKAVLHEVGHTSTSDVHEVRMGSRVHTGNAGLHHSNAVVQDGSCDAGRLERRVVANLHVLYVGVAALESKHGGRELRHLPRVLLRVQLRADGRDPGIPTYVDDAIGGESVPTFETASRNLRNTNRDARVAVPDSLIPVGSNTRLHGVGACH